MGRLNPSTFWLAIALAMSAGLTFFQGMIDAYYFQIIMYVGINAMLASSLNIINGFTGQFSLGHAGFMAIGAYASAYLSSSVFGVTGAGALDVGLFALALVGGGLIAAILGLLVGIPSLRLRGDYLAIVTLGFGEIIRVVIQNLDFLGGARGFTGIPLMTNFFWVFGICAVLVYFTSNIMQTTYGRGFTAVADDEIGAEAMGINSTRYKVIAFVTGAFFAGLAGGLYAHFVTYINPSQFSFVKSIEIVVMVIVGGMANIPGVLLASILLTALPEALRGIAEYRMVIYSLLLVVIMITRPQGLFTQGSFGRFLRAKRNSATKGVR